MAKVTCPSGRLTNKKSLCHALKKKKKKKESAVMSAHTHKNKNVKTKTKWDITWELGLPCRYKEEELCLSC